MNHIETHDLCKTYKMGETQVPILKNVSMSINQGEFIAIVGASGSGKSTLMHLLGCLDTPTSGSYILDGQEVAGLSRDERARVRNQKIGFVFQNFYLLPGLTALDNVALPLLYGMKSPEEAQQRASELLNLVGLADRKNNRPSQLSGGQQQRVAIARSIANHPSILLADEPTGALDSQTGVAILQLLKNLNTEQNMTIVIVTHDNSLAQQTQRIIRMVDGSVE